MENNNLHFITGLMGAGKTKSLIDYYEEASGNKDFVWVFAGTIKPEEDQFKGATITSRDGRSIKAIPINPTETLSWLRIALFIIPKGSLLLIDEIQFLNVRQMDLIIKVAEEKNFRVMFYGLDRDFKNDQFPAVTKLIKTKPKIKFIVTHCQMDDCTDYAENNARIVNGHVVTDGETFLEEKSSYLSICDRCFKKMAIE